jgi:hypothetical protein
MHMLVLFIAWVGVALCQQPPQFGLQIITQFTGVSATDGTIHSCSHALTKKPHLGKYQGSFYQDMTLQNNLQISTFTNGTIEGFLAITARVTIKCLVILLRPLLKQRCVFINTNTPHVQKASYMYESGVGCEVDYLVGIQAFQVRVATLSTLSWM